MVFLTLSHTVEDYKKWRAAFDSHEETRNSFGCKSFEVYVNPDNQNRITVLFEWSSAEDFQKFGKSDELKSAMANAGVLSHPEVKFLQ